MANKRMFSLDIVSSDAFLDMPISSQALYFHLGMYADDEGFVNPKRVMRMISAGDDDLKVLLGKRFVLSFKSGVVVIKHWLIHNTIRMDRFNQTQYQEEKNTLTIKENNSYTELATIWQLSGNQMEPQVKLSEVKLSEIKLGGEDTPAEIARKFFEDLIEFSRVKQNLIENGISDSLAHNELTKFKSYWTEPNKSGTKQRWELEHTFELSRRLATWFRNIKGFNQQQKTNAIKI